MTAERRVWADWVVRIVALLFVVHGALLALSQGANADSVRRDQFGNVLCLASAEIGHAGHDRPAQDHAQVMACCTLACGMFAGLIDPVVVAPLATPWGLIVAAPRFRSYVDVLPGIAETPRNARGPPKAV